MIIIKYKCLTCGLDTTCSVPPRKAEHVNVKWYVEDFIGRYVLTDHVKKSPQCLERKVDLMIPVLKDSLFLEHQPDMCPTCYGTGGSPSQPCMTCEGSGAE